MNLPTFAVLCCIPEQTAYWTFPFSVTPKAGASSVSVRFEKVHCLSQSFLDFKNFAEAVIRDFPDPSIVREVPGFFDLHRTRLLPDRDWSDHFCEIDKDQDFLTRLFYKHILRLRTSVGFSTSEIFPLEWFYLRSSSLADWTEGSLLREVFSELIDYLTPLYFEALGELKKRSTVVGLTFENQEVINFFRAHPVFEGNQEDLGRHERISVRIQDPRIDAHGRFQIDFEEALKQMKVRLRVSLRDQTIG